MKWDKHVYNSIYDVVDNLEELLLKNYPQLSFQILSKNIIDDKCYLKIKYKGIVATGFGIFGNKGLYSEFFIIDAVIYQTKHKYILRTDYPKFKKWLMKKMGCDIWNIRNETLQVYNFPYKVIIFSDDKNRKLYFYNRKIRQRKEKIKYINEMEQNNI